MANIRVTPETLESQGNELVSFASELESILSQINSKIEEIIDAWDGLAQDAYYDMYTTMKTSLDQFPVLVNNLGDVTVQTAQEFSSLDDSLSSAFKSAME